MAEITKVWLKKGIINGDVYGGGFGDNSANALVNGSVQVVVDGGSVTGKVFGANNANGTPLGAVTVTINGTDTPASGYALAEVYGGGNMANYNPTNITPATVVVNGCNNSIGVVYGGGNAADVLGTDVTIWGGTIGQVFGGGHGNKDATPTPTEANVVKRNGNGGDVAVKIYGGTIGEVFGGSNSKGAIQGASTVTIEEHTDANHTTPCTFAVTDVYGGGNQAEGNAGTLNIGCGAVITGNVFGGAKAANVNNDIHLQITGGTLNNVFGGNNESGIISGTITVDIDNNSCNTWHVNNVYGGGKDAAYSAPQGTPNYPVVNLINGTVSTNVFGGGLGETATVTGNPQVNLRGGTVTGKVFGGGEAAPVSGSPVVTATYGQAASVYGGGLGSTAIVTGNPSVTINQTPGQTLTVTDVFGGGDAAQVSGNTTVTLTAGSVTRSFGGGNLAAINGNTSVTLQGATVANIYGGGNEAGVTGTSTVSMTSGSVTAGLYGGCNTQGTITGAVSVSVTGGTVGTDATHTANVHGGGYGSQTATGNDVTVLINGSGVNVWGDVYGGSALGNVNSNAQNANNTTAVTLTAGTIHGSLYGGGLGDAQNAALVNGAVNVTVNGGTVTGAVFGANNVNGTPKGAVTVTINGTDQLQSGYALAEVYGGGNQADYEPTSLTPATVVVNNCNNSIGVVYGGGNAANVPGTDVTIWGGTIGQVFGGGHGDKTANPPTEANVVKRNNNEGGNVAVKIYGGTITEVFGGSNSKGTIEGASTVTIEENGGSCAFNITDVYGGGNQAEGNAGTLSIGCGAIITGNVYGGAKAADVNSDIHLVISGGTLHNVFGGNNEGGSISGTITVDIDKDDQCDSWHVDNVYGGGNLAAYSKTGTNYPVVNVMNGTVSGNVFGGGYGQSARVTANPHVNLVGGTVTGNVFGGGEAAPVTGSPVVTANYGQAANLYGGGLGSTAIVTGNPSVIIELTQGETLSVTDVFGGGDAAKVTGNPTVQLIAGTVANVYGGGKQAEVDGDNTVKIEGGTVTTDVYGGGLQGDVTGNVAVNIGKSNDGTATPHVRGDVYGGGAKANTNTANRSFNSQNKEVVDVTSNDRKKTVVNLYPGATIGYKDNNNNVSGGDVYGGGLGEKIGNVDIPAIVYGDVTVTQWGAVLIADYDNKGLATHGRIFGCNNVNGSPRGHVKVIVKNTTGTTGQQRSVSTAADATHSYELAAVYGGGNKAEYLPYDVDHEKTEVVINPDDCENISIHSVYGGGNAASTPATLVTISGAYEIEYVFGGGNGAGTDNPGANVGYHEYDHNGVHGGSSDEDVEWRRDLDHNLIYGSGIATTNVYGGRIHYIYGGSNTKGNVRETAVALLDEVSTCQLVVDDIYGGGREAYMEGSSMLEMGCVTGMTEIYGGAEKADVGNDIVLTLTSGHYDKVFGGNNKGGRIFGSITVNIE